MTALLVFVALVGRSSGAWGQVPGSLDPTFGFLGALVTTEGQNFIRGAAAVTVERDQRLLVGGRSGIVRYDSDGSVAARILEHHAVSSILSLPDGGILATAGETSFLVRLLPDGTPDPEFGDDGYAAAPEVESPCEFSYGPWPVAAAVQRDGRIIVVANTTGMTPTGRWTINCGDFLVTRYISDGHIDPTFGTNGTTIIDYEGLEAVQAVRLDADDSIVAVASACRLVWNPGPFPNWGAQSCVDDGVLVARLNPDGSLDDRFGNAGLQKPRDYLRLKAVAFDTEGRVLVSDDSRVARLKRNGTLDASFGSHGWARLRGLTANALATDASQRVIVVGKIGQYFGILRLLRTGAVDRRFGYGGYVATMRSGEATAVTVQPNGKIVVAGRLASPGVAVVRLNASR